jgi:hypothetical protein
MSIERIRLVFSSPIIPLIVQCMWFYDLNKDFGPVLG